MGQTNASRNRFTVLYVLSAVFVLAWMGFTFGWIPR